MLELSRESPNIRLHSVKCWPVFFAAITQHGKSFEIRKNDRMYRPGDLLQLNEWHPPTADDLAGGYTGAHAMCLITSVFKADDLPFPGKPLLEKDSVVMGIKVLFYDRAASDGIPQGMAALPVS